MKHQKTFTLYDHDNDYRRAAIAQYPLKPGVGQTRLMKLKALYGDDQDITIFASEHDEQNAQIQRDWQYNRLVTMNGNRPEKLNELTVELLGKIQKEQPWLVLVVSNDPSLAPFMEEAAQNAPVMVFVSSDEVPAAFAAASQRVKQAGGRLDCRFISDLHAEPGDARVHLMVDFENITLVLRDLGITADPLKLRQAIASICRNYGALVNEEYFADWNKLPGGEGSKTQQALAEAQVNTKYIASVGGKNSTDLAMNNEMNAVMFSGQADTLVVATNDGDFRHFYPIARSHGLKIVNIGIHGMVSDKLRQAADEIAYLDDYLPELKERTVPAAEIEQSLATALVRVAAWLRENHWHFFTRGKLMREFEGVLNVPEILEESVAKGLFVPGDMYPATTLALNMADPAVRIAKRLADWLPTTITKALQRGKPFVYESFLIKGMGGDCMLSGLGFQNNDDYALGWLKIAEQAGLVESYDAVNPYNPARTIKAYRIVTAQG